MIPRVIWVNWFQGWQQASPLAKACAHSWRTRNPGWEVRLLDNSVTPRIVDVSAIFPSVAGKWLPAQASSDLLRMAVLATHGGIWVDASLWCAKPLDEWLPERSHTGFFAFGRPAPDRMIDNWFVATTAQQPLVAAWNATINDYWAQRAFWDHYYWHHEAFAAAYATDPAARRIWDSTPFLPAAPCLHFQNRLGDRATVTTARLFNGGGQPVYKLNRRTVPDPPAGTVYEQVIETLNSDGSPGS